MSKPSTALSAFALLLLLLQPGCALLQPKPTEKNDAPRSQPASKSQPKGGGAQQQDEGTYPLDPRYRPLVAIVERPPLPGMSSTAATTISPKVYVVDLDRWLKKHPPGTALFEGVIRHEQLHARRQEAYPGGVDAWVQRYLNDVAFMWDEEQRGWAEQIKFLRYGGLKVSPEGVAKNLANYSNLKGSMVGYADALAWVQDVLANRWRPSK